MYLVALTLLVLSKGRPYYLSPAYPVLIAAGARGAEERLQKLPESIGRILRYAGNGTLSVGAVCIVALTLPLAPVNTGWWKVTSSLNDNLKEEVGWPELVTTVAKVYHNLSGLEKVQTGILAENGGEAGAINLYGTDYGLPVAISGFNSSWDRGYGNPPPRTVIAVGFTADFLTANFESLEAVARVTNRYNVANQETTVTPLIFLCHGLRSSWPEFWRRVRCFG